MSDIPPLTPSMQQRAEKFQAQCSEVLDSYVHNVEMDMNRHAIKHGAMPRERAHYDITMLLMRDLDQANLAGLVAEALLRQLDRKRKGRS